MSAPPHDGNPRDVTPSRKGAAQGGNLLPAGAKLVDEFEIIETLGEGGFGIVYLAYDHTLRRNVAIKEYMPSALASRRDMLNVSVKSEQYAETFAAGLKSFINEARLLAQFDHPGLIKVYRFWEANGTAYMVMPYYEGVNLKAALRGLGAPPDEAWLKRTLAPLLDALEQLHRQSCFHRDISPDNILLLNDGRVLLLDFGAARRVIGDMTQSLTVVLRPGYAPVEQYDDMPQMKQGPWTDIYAFAAVLHFAITGKAPVSSVARLMSDPQQPLHSTAAGRYSEVFLRGIDHALAVLPKDRPQSIAALRAALDLAPQPSNETSRAATASQPAPKRTRLRNVAGAFALITAIGAGAFLLFRHQYAVPPSDEKTAVDASAKKDFSANAMLDDVVRGRDRAHVITVAAENPVARIERDHLRFKVRASHAGHVYVLAIGTAQSDFNLLFPNAVDKDNHIAAGTTLALPRESWTLKALGPAGTDRFVVIVSDEPRDFSGLKPVANDIFQKFPLDVGARLHRDYRGDEPLYAGKVICTAASCSRSYGAAGFSIEEVPDR